MTSLPLSPLIPPSFLSENDHYLSHVIPQPIESLAYTMSISFPLLFPFSFLYCFAFLSRLQSPLTSIFLPNCLGCSFKALLSLRLLLSFLSPLFPPYFPKTCFTSRSLSYFLPLTSLLHPFSLSSNPFTSYFLLHSSLSSLPHLPTNLLFPTCALLYFPAILLHHPSPSHPFLSLLLHPSSLSSPSYSFQYWLTPIVILKLLSNTLSESNA